MGRPFTHWSVRKLRQYLADNPVRTVTIGRERLRQLLDRHGVTFQKTKTWKESNDPDKEAKTRGWTPTAGAAAPDTSRLTLDAFASGREVRLDIKGLGFS